MDKKKEIQRRFGQTMTDAQYLSLGYALDELEKYLIEKACECSIKLHNWPTQYEEYAKLQEEFIKGFRNKMEE